MKQAILRRASTGDCGTFGELELDGWRCVTLELPWRENARGKSCVPAGTYLFKIVDSPKHGRVYQEYDDPKTARKEDVPGRDYVQIHPANLAGDIEKGYVSQLRGCIALGQHVVVFKANRTPAGKMDQPGITASRATVQDFMKRMDGELLELTIVQASVSGGSPAGY